MTQIQEIIYTTFFLIYKFFFNFLAASILVRLVLDYHKLNR